MELIARLTKEQLANLRAEMTELMAIPADWETPEDIDFEQQIILLIDEVEAYRKADAQQQGGEA